jgi:hypothetical protein
VLSDKRVYSANSANIICHKKEVKNIFTARIKNDTFMREFLTLCQLLDRQVVQNFQGLKSVKLLLSERPETL